MTHASNIRCEFDVVFSWLPSINELQNVLSTHMKYLPRSLPGKLLRNLHHLLWDSANNVRMESGSDARLAAMTLGGQ